MIGSFNLLVSDIDFFLHFHILLSISEKPRSQSDEILCFLQIRIRYSNVGTTSPDSHFEIIPCRAPMLSANAFCDINFVFRKCASLAENSLGTTDFSLIVLLSVV